ncbi:hypothetical protein [Roseobacter fucihabitans]|uniref:hypothetical protein n=1 Tax=Roseobacter fucihabitans TaxID=1537242 RepID=UPI00386E986B
MNNLRNRGVEDILIAVIDGLKGFLPLIAASSDCRAMDAITRPSRTRRSRPASCILCAIP